MTKYDEMVSKLTRWAINLADAKCALMRKRIIDVAAVYDNRRLEVLKMAAEKAAALGIASDDDAKMALVLQMVLDSEGIDISDPTPLFTTGEDDNANRTMDGTAAGPDHGSGEGDPGSRDRPGEEARRPSDGPGTNGDSAQPRGKRSRNPARQASS